jgi:hypothetical protein
MIRRAKKLEPMTIAFITHLSTFWFKSVFDPKNYGF